MENDGMASKNVGEKTGQRMGHMNNSGPEGSMEAKKDLKINKKIYIHINTTNPIYSSSDERKLLRKTDGQVSYDGMRLLYE